MYIDRLQMQQLCFMGQPLTDTHSPKHTLGIYLHLYFHHNVYNREEDAHKWGKDEGSPLYISPTSLRCTFLILANTEYVHTHTHTLHITIALTINHCWPVKCTVGETNGGQLKVTEESICTYIHLHARVK